MQAPVLAIPDPAKPFEVVVDACQTGVGAVLLQDGKPVAFTGRQMNPAETRYHTTEQELLAVMFALQQWRCYLQGAQHPFLLVTDHHPNTYFSTQPHLSRRQARWSEKLQEYIFAWSYRPGKKNVADPVSRAPSLQPTLDTCELLQMTINGLVFDWTDRPACLHGGLAEAMTGQAAFVDELQAKALQMRHADCVLAVATRSQHNGGRQADPKSVSMPPAASQCLNQSKPKPAKSALTQPPSPATFGEHDAVRLCWIPELQEAYVMDPVPGDPNSEAAATHKHMKAKNGLWYRMT